MDITLPVTSTLDVLENIMHDPDANPFGHFTDDADRARRIYADVLTAIGAANAPALIFKNLSWEIVDGGRAGEYTAPNHTIALDALLIQHKTRAEIKSVLAHEFAHSMRPGTRHDDQHFAIERALIKQINEFDDRDYVHQLPRQSDVGGLEISFKTGMIILTAMFSAVLSLKFFN